MNTLSLPCLVSIERMMRDLATSSNAALSQSGSELRLRVQKISHDHDNDRVYIRWSRNRKFIKVGQVMDSIREEGEALMELNRRVNELNSQHKAGRLLIMAMAARGCAAHAA